MGLALTQVVTEDRASGGQVIDGSLRFDSGSSNYLNRTPASAGNRRTWTWSGWVKRGTLGSSQNLFGSFVNSTSDTILIFNSDNTLRWGSYYSGSGKYTTSTQVFRDPSAWYHIVWAVDTTQATATDRMKVYVNGSQITSYSGTSVGQNVDLDVNNTTEHWIGVKSFTTGSREFYFDGHMADVNFIDGSALDASYFGFTDPLTNTWRPKKYTGTYGTNGFYLPLDGNSLIGEDKSGNGNDFTPVNFGGSNTIEKATGAFPILNTDDGGNVARVGVRTDAYASNLVLAIPMVGVSSDVSNQINSGSTQKIVTNNGTVTGVSSSSNFYGGSFYFGGTDNYLSFNSSSDLAFGTSPYTVEMWVNPFALPGGGILFSNSSSNGFVTNMDTGGIAINQYGIGDKVATTEGIPLNQWSHLAFVREGTGTNQAKIYVNGVVRATGTDATDWTVTTNPGFGANIAHGGQPINALAQDLRVYKGVAKYTSNFIPASTNPDILPDTPSGVANASTLTKVTDGSVYFDGDGDSLTVPETASDEFTFGTGDWTIEGFVYFPVLPHTEYNTLVTTAHPTNDQGIWFGTNSNGLWWANTAPAGSGWLGGSTGVSAVAKKWHHFAYVRNSDVIKVYIDGVEIYSRSDSSELTNTNNSITIGGRPGQDSNSYLSNVRVVKGTALYTSNFTPPTEPLTNVTNTTLLCCQDTTAFVNGGQPILNTNSTGSTVTSGTRNDHYASSIVLALAMNGSNGGTTFTDQHATIKGSGSAKTITVQNDAQTSTAQSKYYGSSALFDGTGDRLDVGNSSDYAFGTGDYTVEMWVYHTSISDQQTYFSDAFGNHAGVYFYKDTNHKVGLYYGSQIVTGATSITADEWHHIAVTRTGGTSRVFLDGVLDGSGADTTDLTQTTYHIADSDGGSSGEFFGYIQDVRVYKGVAKYTSDFKVTAPTVETPAAVTPGSITANGNAVATTLNPFTTDINTVRGQETSYPTLNPLFQQANVVLSNGNLDFTVSANSSAKVGATIGVSTSQGGKYYWEVTQTSRRRVAAGVMNVVGTGYGFANSSDIGLSPHEWGIRFSNSSTQGAGTAMHRCHNSTVTDFGNIGLENGDTLQIALDLDNTSIWFGANGSWMGGDPETNNRATYTNLTGEIVPFVQRQTGTSGCKINFGQKPFKYAPPEGFKTLCLANLPRPTKAAVRPDKYFKTLIGPGASILDVAQRTFPNGLWWIKDRDNSNQHQFVDSVRGGNTAFVTPNTAADAAYVSPSGNSVAWCWASNDAGYDPETGFQMIRYQGNGGNQDISHDLSVLPDMVWINAEEAAKQTYVWHKAIGATDPPISSGFTQSVILNSSGGLVSTDAFRGQTSSIIRVGANSSTNTLNENYMMYLWKSIPGFSKFGSYTGNASTDGPFVYCGFKPAFVLLKPTVNDYWMIFDTARTTYNPVEWGLFPNDAIQETYSTNYTTDLLSNGFKLRTSSFPNRLSTTIIFAAFAEAPTNNLYGGQANAR